jgi:hypothetical protein
MQLDGLKLHQLYAVRRHWVRLGDLSRKVGCDIRIDSFLDSVDLSLLGFSNYVSFLYHLFKSSKQWNDNRHQFVQSLRSIRHAIKSTFWVVEKVRDVQVSLLCLGFSLTHQIVNFYANGHTLVRVPNHLGKRLNQLIDRTYSSFEVKLCNVLAFEVVRNQVNHLSRAARHEICARYLHRFVSSVFEQLLPTVSQLQDVALRCDSSSRYAHKEGKCCSENTCYRCHPISFAAGVFAEIERNIQAEDRYRTERSSEKNERCGKNQGLRRNAMLVVTIHGAPLGIRSIGGILA